MLAYQLNTAVLTEPLIIEAMLDIRDNTERIVACQTCIPHRQQPDEQAGVTFSVFFCPKQTFMDIFSLTWRMLLL
ncbi:hypothetical protein EB820_08510 [Brevibacillus agri]|uniref:Uncharacterized protein n=1 Tax=Brevibacillus agri TaxID=51101 RepID=A0A3M8AZT1_9BACL|nr:hypothetical protein BA6348_14440 [Brevibacillus agri]RNB56689.1 hypothetical protein EB820_08510 [Brevibacillus agri]